MSRPKPIPTAVRSTKNEPVTKRPSQPKRWTFSFRFWREIENFGLSKREPKWFASLLTRLCDLSCLTVDEVTGSSLAQDWRYHPINWQQKNIPIQRIDLKWVEKTYLENADDYPLMQLTIGKALGRIVGFLDDDNVFNIVLLDPLHNIQPTQLTGYRVDPCDPLGCEYTSLLGEIDAAKKTRCSDPNCPTLFALRQIPREDKAYNALIIRVPNQLCLDLENRIDSGITVEEILEYGVTFFDESQTT